MTDRATRELERAVAAEPQDPTSRHELTIARLRAKRGVLAWWHGLQRPHVAAAKVALAHECVDPTSGEVRSRPEVVGWGLAVTTPEDLLDVAAARAGCTLYELGTGRAVGICGEAQSFGRVTEFKAGAATLDAFGRPRDVRAAAREGRDAMGDWGSPDRHVTPIVPMLAYGSAIDSRQSVEPMLFDTEDLDRQLSAVSFFSSLSAAGSTGRRKAFGWDVNIHGSNGLPQAHVFVARGVGLHVSHLDDEADRERAEAVVARASLEFQSGMRTHHVAPAAHALVRGAGAGLLVEGQGEVDARTWGSSAPAALPFAVAVVIQSLEQFRVDLRFLDARDWPASPFRVRCVLHGDLYRGICG